jgi:isoquinoline 1-oxidoreductase alpha subunit
MESRTVFTDRNVRSPVQATMGQFLNSEGKDWKHELTAKIFICELPKTWRGLQENLLRDLRLSLASRGMSCQPRDLFIDYSLHYRGASLHVYLVFLQIGGRDSLGVGTLDRESTMTRFALEINSRQQTVDADPEMPLLWVLRDLLNMTGTKYGCGIGLCGACTVQIDGVATRSCQTPIATAAGKRILTIEGLAANGPHPIQDAWIAEQVPQCGYCQPGQIMSAAALLAQKTHPTDADIDEAMAGNLCRCATYFRIRNAIHRAAGETHS